jgi:hypothetical protein
MSSNKENPLWNLNELCSNWMVFFVFVSFLSVAGIYQHYKCIKMNNGKKFEDDKNINGMYIAICACAAIAGLLLLGAFIQRSKGLDLNVA